VRVEKRAVFMAVIYQSDQSYQLKQDGIVVSAWCVSQILYHKLLLQQLYK